MKNQFLFSWLIFLCLNLSNIRAQNEMFYGTIETEAALKLKKLTPNDVIIISSLNGYSAIKLNEKAAEKLHHMILTHGPGFIFEKSKEQAIRTIKNHHTLRKQRKVANFSITEDQNVNRGISLVNNANIDAHIRELEAYDTRFHTTESARQSIADLRKKWKKMSRGRTDVSVRTVKHESSEMPSLIMTIKGQELPDEYVIVGGHMDTTSPQRETLAPGADDNASGIAAVTEMARVLFEMNYQPKRSIEFMAFAAEEVGLRGSREIAQDYKNRNVNVVSYVQFDMTNYKGSSSDIYLTDDTYNSSDLNSFLVSLMTHYNASGKHQFTYDYTRCNYGCSDHYSWAQQGYAAAFPFEAAFSDYNPYIHTTGDTSDKFPTPNATHAAKFTKLGIEYLIEASKSLTNSNYCSSNGRDVRNGYIQNITIGSINNSSSAQNGYQDFGSLNTDLKLNDSHNISISAKKKKEGSKEGYTVWIDYNQDSDFDDNGELVFSNVTTKSSIKGTFNIPSSAKLGKTRMRVSMKKKKVASPCESFKYGEVEDYSVTIVEARGAINIRKGVPAYNPNLNYTSGDEVIYFNSLYERTPKGWKKTSSLRTNRETDEKEIPKLVDNDRVILLSPNPIKSNSLKIKVQNELWKARQIIIYDINGNLLRKVSMKNNERNIEISSLSTGIYFISLSDTDNAYVQRLIKQ